MGNQAADTGAFAPVRYAVTVPLPAERAFALFTEGYNSWWPGHHIGTAEMAEAVLEPRAGGRYYERGVDGSECEWGKVLACDPPRRIVVAWQITVKGGTAPEAGRASWTTTRRSRRRPDPRPARGARTWSADPYRRGAA